MQARHVGGLFHDAQLEGSDSPASLCIPTPDAERRPAASHQAAQQLKQSRASTTAIPDPGKGRRPLTFDRRK